MMLLGVDIGTTRIKAVAYSEATQRLVAQADTATPTIRLEYGDAHEPDALYAAAVGCLHEVVARLDDPTQIRALCVVSIGEEVVIVDSSGEPIMPTPAWYSAPGARYARLLAEAGLAMPGQVDPTFSAFTLRWLHDARRDLVRAAAGFTDVASYLLARLAGTPTTFTMDYSHASRTGFFAVTPKAYADELLDWAGGWESRAPRLVPSGTILGTVSRESARELGIPAGVALVAGAHDHFAAAYASGVRLPGHGMISSGTSEAQLVLTSDPPREAPELEVGCFVDGATYYVHRGMRAGQLFARWRDLLGMTGAIPTACFAPPIVPATPPPRCLVAAGADAVSFLHLPIGAEAQDVIRCLSEGLAVAAKAILGLLEDAAATRIAQLTVAGAATSDDAWLTMRAAILDRPLQVVTAGEPAALGAALLAQRAITGQADLPLGIRRIEPPTPGSPAYAYYADLMAHYRKADL